MHDLDRVFEKLGIFQDAKALYMQVQAGTEGQFGVADGSTLVVVEGLASLYEIQGKYNEAKSGFLRALAGYEQQLGADCPETLITVHSLARLY